MKRYVIHILIGMALCLQACRGNIDTEEMAIDMTAASVEGTTRALINSVADLHEFCVDGYKEGTSNEQVFNKHLVVQNANSGKWEYSPTRYWDRKGTYYFGAYAPEDITVNRTKDKGVLAISAPNWQTIDGNEKDIVVATSKGTATYYIDTHYRKVKFDFEHILAQLEVQIVRSSLSSSEFRLTQLTYGSVPEQNESTSYNFDYALPAHSAMGSAVLGSMVAYSDATGVVVPGETDSEVAFKHLVVPFALTDSKVMTITVRYNASFSSKSREVTVGTGLTAMEAGKRYVLKLTFNGGMEISTSLEVADWNTEEVEEDDKYNW